MKKLLFLSALLAAPAAAQVKDGRLPACPSAPHCYSGELPFSDDAPAAWARLKEALKTVRRLKLMEEKDGYLHAVVTSCVFRFKDDVEFLLDAPGKKIDVRSSSRIGYYDFGVNRKRVEKIRRAFTPEAARSTTPPAN